MRCCANADAAQTALNCGAGMLCNARRPAGHLAACLCMFAGCSTRMAVLLQLLCCDTSMYIAKV